jgi:hypothetical protein
VAKRNQLTDHLGSLAVTWIHQAQKRKYLSAPSTRWLLADDRDLDSLRGRADFRELLTPGKKASKSAK